MSGLPSAKIVAIHVELKDRNLTISQMSTIHFDIILLDVVLLLLIQLLVLSVVIHSRFDLRVRKTSPDP